MCCVVPFEIRLLILSGDKRRRFLETVVGLEKFVDLVQIRQVVGRHMNYTGPFQGEMNCIKKGMTEYPVIMVPLFRPGIGEKDVIGRNAFRRDEVPHTIVRFHPEEPNISEVFSFNLPADLMNSIQHPFDTEEVRVPVRGRAG